MTSEGICTGESATIIVCNQPRKVSVPNFFKDIVWLEGDDSEDFFSEVNSRDIVIVNGTYRSEWLAKLRSTVAYERRILVAITDLSDLSTLLTALPSIGLSDLYELDKSYYIEVVALGSGVDWNSQAEMLSRLTWGISQRVEEYKNSLECTLIRCNDLANEKTNEQGDRLSVSQQSVTPTGVIILNKNRLASLIKPYLHRVPRPVYRCLLKIWKRL